MENGNSQAILLARRTEEGMEPDDLLCSRNARPQKALVGREQWKINQPPSLEKNEQAWKEHVYRPMRAGKDNLAIPFIGWMSQEEIDLRRLLKKPASKAAADESTGGVASGLR